MKIWVDTKERLEELISKNYNDPYTMRKFRTDSKELYDGIVEAYRDNFAFSIHFDKQDHVFYKENGDIYFRIDDSERKNKPVSHHYDHIIKGGKK